MGPVTQVNGEKIPCNHPRNLFPMPGLLQFWELFRVDKGQLLRGVEGVRDRFAIGTDMTGSHHA